MTADLPLHALLQFRKGATGGVGAERVRLLEAIGRHGSITAAAKEAGLSYKGAWDAVQAMNNLFAHPLVAARPGGRSGGVASVTPAGLAVIEAFGMMQARLAAVADQLDQALRLDEGALAPLLGSFGMRTSARNALRGVVQAITDGAVNAQVVLRIAPDLALTATITRDSVAALGLAPGVAAVALIKASWVILAAGHAPLRTSARNVLKGVVSHIETGAVNDEITLDLTHGKTLTATITRDSAEALGLQVGDPAQALVKASHIILAVE